MRFSSKPNVKNPESRKLSFFIIIIAYGLTTDIYDHCVNINCADITIIILATESR